MRYHRLAFAILLFLSFINLNKTAIAQPQRIVNGELLQRWWEKPRTVPIQRWRDTLYVMLTDYESTRLYWMNLREYLWWQDNALGFDHDYLEFFMGPSTTKYAYGYWAGILWYVNDNEVIWREVPCPGRPVIDQENNLHVIWEAGEDTLCYGFSRDTLTTFEVIDTLVAFPRFVYLVSSPDHAIIGAVFLDPQADSLYKFTAIDGNPIDFSSHSSRFYDANLIDAYDFMLDHQGRLIFVEYSGGCPWSWGAHYVWTEQYGLRLLECADDEALQPVCFEIAFGPDDGEVLLIASTYFMYYLRWTWFLASLDGGDTWYRSGLTLDAKYGSSLRSYDDNLDLVYDGEDAVYYYRVPRELIFDDLTGLPEERQGTPRVISLSNHPNPFNSYTSISFTVLGPSQVDLSIFDIRGRLVNTLLRSSVEAGYHSLVWDGTDRFGNSVSSGVYIYRIKVDEYNQSRRMLLLK